MKFKKTVFMALLASGIAFFPQFILQSYAEKSVISQTNEKMYLPGGAVVPVPDREIKKKNSSVILESFARQPLFFIQNDGQIDRKVKFYEKGSGHATYFAEDGIYLSLFRQHEKENQPSFPMEKKSSGIQSDHIKLSFVNAEISPEIEAEGILQTRFNYFSGNDSSQWHRDIPTYTTVRYREIYKNIDLEIYGNEQQLEYDVIVKPGGDPECVKFRYEDANSLEVNGQGELEIELDHGTLIQKVPYLYQEVAGRRVEVDGSFKLLTDDSYTFVIASYDTERPLVIDPVIDYASYLGGSGYDVGNAIALDNNGNVYITGRTASSTFPGADSSRDVATYHNDVFVTKRGSDGTMLNTTIFGGTNQDEISGATPEAGYAIAVDSAGYVHVTGVTRSTDFPLSASPYQSSLSGNQIVVRPDAFYVRLDSSLNIVYSTYFGGVNSDFARAIAADDAGNVFIAGGTSPISSSGGTSSFPILNALQSTYGGFLSWPSTYSDFPPDGFIAKFHYDTAAPSQSTLVFSTYFGGNGNDIINGLVLDGSGDIYVTGEARSTNLPGTSASPIQSSLGGGADAFIAKINAAGDTIVYSTYLGGSNMDYGLAIDVDSAGAAYITGYIYAAAGGYNFPLVNPIQDALSGMYDAFVTKINETGSSIVYSTFLGGSGDDEGNSISVDSSGTAYVGGYSRSAEFPIVNPINGYETYDMFQQAFLVRLSPSGGGFLYSTFYGGNSAETIYGLVADDNGNAYITGLTNSACLPVPEIVEGEAYCISGYGGGYGDGYVARISDSSAIPPEVVTVFPAGGSTDASVDAVITATFSKDMDTTRFDGNFFLSSDGIPVPGTVGNSGLRVATFTPAAPLSAGRTYTATITTGVEDAENASLLVDYSWDFTAALDTTPPEVISTYPAEYEMGVPVDAVVTVMFSKDINPATLTDSFYLQYWDAEYNLIRVTGTPSYNPATFTATFTPETDLLYQTNITLVVEKTVTDYSGNPLFYNPPWWPPDNPPYTGPFQSSFDTACDPLAPDFQSIVSSTPAVYAADVPVDIVLSVTFDRDMDPATINTSNVTLNQYSPSYINFQGNVSFDGARTVTFTPDALLEEGITYYLVFNGIADAEGRLFCTSNGNSIPFTTTADSTCSTDADPPSITPPADVTINCTGLGGTAVNIGTPTVSDTCDANPSVVNDAPVLFPVGTTTVTWTAMDASGNSDTASQIVTISDPQNVCEGPVILESPFSDEPPAMDGVLGFGEWSTETSNQLNIENGFIRVSNDRTRLYILIDLPADDVDNVDVPRDFFNLTFDVNNDGIITPDTDINYTLYSDVANIRYRYYTGPDSWSDWAPETFSSMARGFGCAAGDGSLTISMSSPPVVTCNQHRLWEIAIDLKEINAGPGTTAAMGLQVASPDPSFIENFPAAFTDDFTNLLDIHLGDAPAIADPAVTGSVSLEWDAITDAVEVTQAIQDRQNSLPLVQDKDTVARVYAVADSGALSPTLCLVSLYGQKDGVDLPGSPLTLFHRAPLVIDRETLHDTANFKLPKTWTQGDVVFYAVVRGLEAGDLGDTSLTTPLTFTQKEIPIFWTIKLNTGTEAVPRLVTDEELSAQKDFLKTIYPLADVNFIDKSWEGVGVTTAANALADLNEYYDLTFMGWVFGALITGEAPFDLPRQIYGMTVEGGGLSDPVRSGGRGIVARGGSNSGANSEIMAHEMNHNLGPGDCQLRVTDGMFNDTWGSHVSSLGMPPAYSTDPVWNCVAGDTSPAYGCMAKGSDPDWQELFDDGNILEVGFDTRLPWQENDGTRTTIVPADTPDLMTYCDSGMLPVRWNSAYRWERQFDAFLTIVDVPPMAASMSYEASDIALIEDVYYVNGQINFDGFDITGSLNPIISSQGIPLFPEMPGQYIVDFLDDQGAVLQTYSFYAAFEEEDDDSGSLAEQTSFNFRLPVLQGQTVDTINLSDGAQILDSITVSINAPQVTIDSPNGGETWNGFEPISWHASDSDNDPLVFSVLYSPDNGNKWIPIAGNLQNSPYVADTSIIPGGTGALIRIIATDGFHTAMDDSDAPFTVEQNPPSVTLIEPTDGRVFEAGTKMVLRGQATDPEDEILSEDAFAWFLNGQVIAVGRRAEVSLPVGLHELTLRVTDSDGDSSESNRTIEGLDCLGDFDGDGDVDGLDLADQARRATGISPGDFAAQFGITGCQ
ncbi:MAG: Ig-like domain-containing protein [Desulfobulbaceae bacterium]|nr:Ig-like domain-containing protein [Desulfobulbaceae bacterium]